MRYLVALVLIVVVPCAAGETLTAKADQPLYVPYGDMAELLDPRDKAILMDRNRFEELLIQAKAN